MFGRVASVLSVAAALTCLATGGSSDPSMDEDSPPELSGADASTAPLGEPQLSCTAKPGVEYSLERCNKTNKVILKILVKDHYDVPSLPTSTPPTTASPTSESLWPLTSSEAPQPATSSLATPSSEENIETTTEYVPDSSVEKMASPFPDYVIDDWDYMYESETEFPEESDFIGKERDRHDLQNPYDPRGIFAPQYPNHEFCEAAAKDDEEPLVVSDGSFHPRFEEVPGVGVYRLHARARSWADARKVCEREGAQLAVPNSREEALALVEMHNRCPLLLPTHFNDYQYLGVHDQYSEGHWETVVGDPLNETGYVRWARNQPDNAHHHGENCLTMNRASSFNDVPCWTELPFICEHA